MTEPTQSLKEFAMKAKPPCLVCSLPPELKEQVVWGWHNDIKATLIVNWLKKTHGIEATIGRVRNHFSQEHS